MIKPRGARYSAKENQSGWNHGLDFDRSSLSLLFIHGSGGDLEGWRHQLDGLSGLATVIALELPGHGASEPPGESSVPAYADWVANFVKALGVDDCLERLQASNHLAQEVIDYYFFDAALSLVWPAQEKWRRRSESLRALLLRSRWLRW